MVINKVIQSYQDVDNMEIINKICELSPFETDNWCDLEQFEEYPELKQYISDEEYKVLLNGKADYIAFRIDR